ncbi:MAG: hypothetical protein D6766_14675, partial [Verrucomicrobia bacterium]
VPPLVVGAALLLWGWQAGWLAGAAAMAAAWEAALAVRWRVDPAAEDWARLWNLTMLLFLGAGLYLFLARQGWTTVGTVVATGTPAERLQGLRRISENAATMLRWLPVVFFPMALVWRWSRWGPLPVESFSAYLRHRLGVWRREGAGWRPVRVAPDWVFLGLVLLAASTNPSEPGQFLPLATGLLACALWPWRSRRFPAWVWAVLVGFLFLVSFAAEQGFTLVRRAYQQWEERFVTEQARQQFDQLRNRTSLGSIGRIKRSAAIVLRVRTDGEEPPPLLREAVFDRFVPNVWVASAAEFQPVLPSAQGALWWLQPHRPGGRHLTVSRYSAGGETAVALPGGALSVRNLAAMTLETNLLGSVRVKGAASLTGWTVEYLPDGPDFASPPGPMDLALENLPPAERRVIELVGNELGLRGMEAARAVETVRQFFLRNFQYALWQPYLQGATNSCALEAFLLERRRGHCEYFATATALLLRVAGVPTRYAVGFVARERHGDVWVARGRDAHAWCLAWVDGRWQTVDTTPPDWFAAENARVSSWQKVWDWFSDRWHAFQQWRQQGGSWQLYVFVAAMAVLAWLGWRQVRGMRWRARKLGPERAGEMMAGADSPFYRVTRVLEEHHGPRAAHETLAGWMARLRLLPPENGDGELGEMLRLHLAWRFDPRGLPEEERRRLTALVENWLQRRNRLAAG